MKRTPRHKKPKHFWIQIVYLDESTKNIKLLVTPYTCRIKAEQAARADNVDVVFILDGNADPDNVNVLDIIDRIEPKPFTECGKEATPVTHAARLLHLKTPGSQIVETISVTTLAPIFSTMNRNSKPLPRN